MHIADQFYFIILNHKGWKSILKNLKLLLKFEGLLPYDIRLLQQKKLEQLWNHARHNVAYWSAIDVSGSENNPQELLNSLPILTKSIIRKQDDKMWAANISNYIVATTGGTTGYPLTIRRDLNCDAITKAALWRARLNWGITPATRTLYLNTFGKGTRLGRLRMRLAKKRLGEAFPSSTTDVMSVVKQIQKFKPTALEGFATGLLSLLNKETTSAKLNIPTIVSTGEMLYPYQREMLQNALAGKVYTYYGSNEIGSIAFECENQQLHICEEHVLVETVDDNGKVVFNEPGRVLVTDLDNYAMPFIRYELGDIAVITEEACPCGRPTKVISKLLGRSQDYLSGTTGNKLQATQLAGYLKDLTTTGQLQFVQESSTKITILYDGNFDEAAEELKGVKAHLINRLGNDVNLHFKQVDSIKKTKRGKQPLVVRK